MKDNDRFKIIPNIITIIRIIMVPVFVYIFIKSWNNNSTLYWPLAIFIIIMFSDVLDGYLARKLNAISDFGKLMDPLADKLLTVSALVSLWSVGYLPLFALIIVAVKELLLILGGIVLYNQKITVFANKTGKVASFVTGVAVSACFLHGILEPYDWYMLYLALALQVFAFLHYAYVNVFLPLEKGEIFDKK